MITETEIERLPPPAPLLLIPEKPTLPDRENGSLARWALDLEAAFDEIAANINRIKDWADVIPN